MTCVKILHCYVTILMHYHMHNVIIVIPFYEKATRIEFFKKKKIQ